MQEAVVSMWPVLREVNDALGLMTEMLPYVPASHVDVFAERMNRLLCVMQMLLTNVRDFHRTALCSMN